MEFQIGCICALVCLYRPTISVQLPTDWRSRIDATLLRPSPFKGAEEASDILYKEGSLDHPGGEPGKLPPDHYWPNGGTNIPYHISPSFGNMVGRAIKQAMLTISRRTLNCITFRKRANETDYISFHPSSRCASHVGRVGGAQQIFLGEGCAQSQGTIQHEILHALGLYHEQNRPDRDPYVEVFEDNILPGAMKNYAILPGMDTYGTQYDLESLMHYAVFDFAIDTAKPVIQPKAGRSVRMGQRDGLSILDAAKIQNAYRCRYDNLEAVIEAPVKISTQYVYPLPEFNITDWKNMQCTAHSSPKCPNSGRLHSAVECGLRILDYGFCNFDRMSIQELKTVASIMSQPPIRAVSLRLADHWLINSEVFEPVHRQVVEFEWKGCKTPRVTSKLADLRFVNLLRVID